MTLRIIDVLAHVYEIYLYSTHVVENYKNKTRVKDEKAQFTLQIWMCSRD